MDKLNENTRCEQLQKLSQEHQDSLLMAEKLATIAETGTEASLREGMDLLKKYNETELETHLQHEERMIFAPLIQEYGQYVDLCITLGKEHGFLRTIVEEISLETAQKDLADFARVLKSHSIVEETELFPIIESLFSEEQLDRVLNFEPWLPLH